MLPVCRQHRTKSHEVFNCLYRRLVLLLRALGLRATCLHGNMSQEKRIGALARFKSHKDKCVPRSYVYDFTDIHLSFTSNVYGNCISDWT